MNIKGITYQGALFKRPADKALKIAKEKFNAVLRA